MQASDGHREILKKLFREKYLACLREAGITYPPLLHKIPWVVNIQAVGNGEPALKYLSGYLYSGVIREWNILSDTDGKITFEYEDSETKTRKTRTLPAVDFLFLFLKHVLPKRFRRCRDYGFHHSNARKTLAQIRLLLHFTPFSSSAGHDSRFALKKDNGRKTMFLTFKSLPKAQ